MDDLQRPLRVGVVVPVRDEPRLELCLRALLQQMYDASLLEVVVADNGSAVPVASQIASLVAADGRISVVDEPGGGSYRARNAAVRALGDVDVIAFTDGDCIPASDWIARGVALLKAGVPVVAGRVEVFAQEPDRPTPVEAHELVHAFPQEKFVRMGFGVTANLLMLRSTFEAVGPFNSELKSGGDAEWGMRAKAAGRAVVYAEDVVVLHPARRSMREALVKLMRVHEGRRNRAALGEDVAAAAFNWRYLRPPFGAFRRARTSTRLSTRWARVNYVLGDFFMRYAEAAAAFRFR